MNGKTILVTGGTGSFGKSFVSHILKNYSVKKIIIFSRDEMKQWEMSKLYENEPRIRFFIGDVRDRERLSRAVSGVDIVIHAAAIKIVPTAEYNPIEPIKTNIFGAMNLIDACIDNGVEKVVALSTDKASSPINLYGATKLVSDKLFVSANHYSSTGGSCLFSVVRYGNVMGSRGSVIPFFYSKRNDDYLPITDENMTRFMITLDQGVDLVCTAIGDMIGGEIYVRKIPSMNIMDIANTIGPNMEKKSIGIRPGEKLHEQMIGLEDAEYTYEYDSYYKILPQIQFKRNPNDWIKKGKRVEPGFSYSSDNNSSWMSTSELSAWIEENKHNWPNK